jgi:hypothetical protein
VLAMYCSTALYWTRRALPPATRHRVAVRIIQLGWRPARSIGNAAGVAKWTKAGREVLRVIPRSSGNDLNEIVRKWAIA